MWATAGAAGMGGGAQTAARLRRELADWVERHPDEPIAETPLRDWVKARVWSSRDARELALGLALTPASCAAATVGLGPVGG